jgi:RpiB/LacA/LacB family sugar-phosphate isomerase
VKNHGLSNSGSPFLIYRGAKMKTKRLVIASDHGGIEMKDALVTRLREAGYEVEDIGTHSTESVHYPNFAFDAANKVASGEVPAGVLVCGTGIGMSIAANKVHGIYCAKVNSEEEGRLAAEHNHANMLALGGRTTDLDTSFKAIIAWTTTDSGGGRHAERVDLIKAKDC